VSQQAFSLFAPGLHLLSEAATQISKSRLAPLARAVNNLLWPALMQQ
jgi:hypothetical protein